MQARDHLCTRFALAELSAMFPWLLCKSRSPVMERVGYNHAGGKLHTNGRLTASGRVLKQDCWHVLQQHVHSISVCTHLVGLLPEPNSPQNRHA